MILFVIKPVLKELNMEFGDHRLLTRFSFSSTIISNYPLFQIIKLPFANLQAITDLFLWNLLLNHPFKL